jgi:molybdopterin converting factor small subunit
MKLQIVFLGRSYHAAQGLPSEMTLDDQATLDDAIAQLRTLPESVESLPETCLISLSGRHVGTIGDHPPTRLRDGDELVLIAPVAGG